MGGWEGRYLQGHVEVGEEVRVGGWVRQGLGSGRTVGREVGGWVGG